jgi:hypothetical protein
MSMIETRIGDQVFVYDRDATVAVYNSLAGGFAEECRCVACRNFAAQRDLIFPPSFRTLLEQLGIDPNKEGEAFEYGPIADGRHLYGGWFYFFGELRAAGEYNVEQWPDFNFFFSKSHPPAPKFRGGPVLAIEFEVKINWVLNESPQYGTRAKSPVADEAEE